MDNETLDPRYAAVFADSENGTPDNITQAGCLALAQLGKEAWNSWRSDYPVGGEYPDKKNIADFSEVNFKECSINFESFIFGDETDFTGAQFGNNVDFKRAQFGDMANFEGTQFDFGANFESAQFGGNASFKNSKFGLSAQFVEARFASQAQFDGTWFDDDARFMGAQFGDSASFERVEFDGEARFSGAQFGNETKFIGTRFNETAYFSGAQFQNNARFKGAWFGNNARFVGMRWDDLRRTYSEQGIKTAKDWAENHGLSPDTFKPISFAGAFFKGRVDFSNRSFTGTTLFGCLERPIRLFDHDCNGNYVEGKLNVSFCKAPLFHNCKLHQDTTFDGAEFPEPSSDPVENDIAARAYRTLKLAFSQHQAIREEQLFFRLEMAEEAAKLASSQQQTIRKKQSFFICLLEKANEILVGIWQLSLVLKKAQNNSHRARICLFFSYKWLSNYGFSFGRSTALLFIALLVFLGIYTLLADLTPCLLTYVDCQIRYDLIQFTLLQALPLPGLDKWSDSLRSDLFPDEGWKSVAFTAALMIHKAISLLAVFLFGLALRNLFKMK